MSDVIFKAEPLNNVLRRLNEAWDFAGDDDLIHVLEGVRELLRQEYGPFICGTGGDVENGLHESIYVCPAMGSNRMGVYKLVHQGNGGQ